MNVVPTECFMHQWLYWVQSIFHSVNQVLRFTVTENQTKSLGYVKKQSASMHLALTPLFKVNSSRVFVNKASFHVRQFVCFVPASISTQLKHVLIETPLFAPCVLKWRTILTVGTFRGLLPLHIAQSGSSWPPVCYETARIITRHCSVKNVLLCCEDTTEKL